MTDPGATAALLARPRPASRRPRALMGLALGALALAATALGALALAPGLRVAFLLGAAGKGGAGKLGPFVAQINGMAAPLSVVGAAVAVVGAIAGGILLAIGHPHGARMLGRVALGAVVIAAAGTVVS